MEMENSSQPQPPAAPGFVKYKVSLSEERGDRPSMEDCMRFAYEKNAEGSITTVFFAMFDGFCGREAAEYTKKFLLEHITSRPDFESQDDTIVLQAIKDGFLSLQAAMHIERNNSWPTTSKGDPSISGTTATVVFAKNGKLYIGNVGNTAVVLGTQDPAGSGRWIGEKITQDHKPGSAIERARIEEAGGEIILWKGVTRVHKEGSKPALNLGRSLGAFWSWNEAKEEYIISPIPDTMVVTLDPTVHRCLIVASDGLWNMCCAEQAVEIVRSEVVDNSKEKEPEPKSSSEAAGPEPKEMMNPSARLVKYAADEWKRKGFSSDNISALTVVFEFL